MSVCLLRSVIRDFISSDKKDKGTQTGDISPPVPSRGDDDHDDDDDDDDDDSAKKSSRLEFMMADLLLFPPIDSEAVSLSVKVGRGARAVGTACAYRTLVSGMHTYAIARTCVCAPRLDCKPRRLGLVISDPLPTHHSPFPTKSMRETFLGR